MKGGQTMMTAVSADGTDGLPPAPHLIAREVEDVLALATAIGPPLLVAGHSSGAVVALEAMARAPGTFAGAVLFEPPVATGPPDPSGAAAIARANAAADGKPGKAGQIFVRDIVGIRLDAYAKISIPVVLLGAERSPGTPRAVPRRARRRHAERGEDRPAAPRPPGSPEGPWRSGRSYTSTSQQGSPRR